MGQYYTVANLDKKEFLYAHKMDSGLKFWEIVNSNIPRVLAFLLWKSDGRGGGDGDVDDNELVKKYAGRWAQNRIVMIGDYDESGLYEQIDDGEQKGVWKDISIPCSLAYNKWNDYPDHTIKLDFEHNTDFKEEAEIERKAWTKKGALP